MAHHGSETIFAVEHITNRAAAGRAHGPAAITTVAGFVHIGMDSTLHRVLPSARRKNNFPLSTGSSSGSTSKQEWTLSPWAAAGTTSQDTLLCLVAVRAA